jgi:hypothetical protein
VHRFRFIIACLLLLVLPLQGMAAALKLTCLAHESDAPLASHVHANGAAHEHHAFAADHDQDNDGIQHAAHHNDASCSVCAACCHGAVASQAIVVPSFAVPAHGVAPVIAVALRLRATPPPDKPPRA